MTLLRILGIDRYTVKFKEWIRNKFIAKGGLKTINGEPIEGEGDIEISGGGSSATPDWNAQANEDGYIKNKPFGFDDCMPEDIIVENPMGDFEMEILRYSEEDGWWGYHDDLGDNPLVVLTRDGIIIAEMQLAPNTSKENGNGDFLLKLEDNVLYIQGWSDSESETFKYYIGEPKQLNEVFIPDTIARKSDLEDIGGGADWNAQKGEVGYIKNKPYEIFKSTIKKVDDNTLRVHIAEDEYGGNDSVLGHYLKWDGSLYKLQYDETNLEIGSGRFKLYVTYGDGYYYLTHNQYDADYVLSNFINYPDTNSIFYVTKGIDATCLTNDVVKTTPQTLSDADKKQVLTNLGLNDLPNGFTSKFQLYKENGGTFFSNENLYNIFDALRNESANYYMDLSIDSVLDIGISYSFSDLGISYHNLLGIIYYSKNVIISFGKDFITLTCPGEGNDRSLSFESDAGYNMTINIVEQTLILNQN